MVRRLANHHIHSSGESNGEQRKKGKSHDANIGAAAIKGTSRDEATLNSGEIKPVALAISDKLKASESQPDSQSVSQ